MKFLLFYFDKEHKPIHRVIYCDIVQLSSDRDFICFYKSNILIEFISRYDVIELYII